MMSWLYLHLQPPKNGRPVDYQVGTMLELPRACLIADTLAVRLHPMYCVDRLGGYDP